MFVFTTCYDIFEYIIYTSSFSTIRLVFINKASKSFSALVEIKKMPSFIITMLVFIT